MTKTTKQLIAAAIAGTLMASASASVMKLGPEGEGTFYLDPAASRYGNVTISLNIDIANNAHGALNFSNTEGTGLLNCNLAGSTFTANGFTCTYTNGMLSGFSPAPNAIKVKSTGTSETMTVSFGVKAN